MSHTPPEFEFEGTTTRATGLADMATPLERELFAKVAALTAECDRMAAIINNEIECCDRNEWMNLVGEVKTDMQLPRNPGGAMTYPLATKAGIYEPCGHIGRACIIKGCYTDWEGKRLRPDLDATGHEGEHRFRCFYDSDGWVECCPGYTVNL